MRISDEQRVLFVHIPKNAGSSIDGLFDDNIADRRRIRTGAVHRHSTYGEIVAHEPGVADYWSFGVVRNPWARMVSWYAMFASFFERVDEGRPYAVKKLAKPGRSHYHDIRPHVGSFESFVLEGTKAVDRLARPQVEWLVGEDGEIAVDHVGRQEDLTVTIDLLRAKLGLPPTAPLPRRNVSSHGHYSDYYDARTQARVEELFAPDIEHFGYEFEGP